MKYFQYNSKYLLERDVQKREPLQRYTNKILLYNRMFFLKNHLEQSNETVRCPYCDTAFSTTTAMDEHINKTCPLVPVNCALKSYGCEAKVYILKIFV